MLTIMQGYWDAIKIDKNVSMLLSSNREAQRVADGFEVIGSGEHGCRAMTE